MPGLIVALVLLYVWLLYETKWLRVQLPIHISPGK
jgi:hypothetical protein